LELFSLVHLLLTLLFIFLSFPFSLFLPYLYLFVIPYLFPLVFWREFSGFSGLSGLFSPFHFSFLFNLLLLLLLLSYFLLLLLLMFFVVDVGVFAWVASSLSYYCSYCPFDLVDALSLGLAHFLLFFLSTPAGFL